MMPIRNILQELYLLFHLEYMPPPIFKTLFSL